MPSAFEGQAQVFHEESLLGTVRITVGPTRKGSDGSQEGEPWRGQIIGSDYLMWGMNHKKVRLLLPTGKQLFCVVLASGKLRGLPEFPKPSARTSDQ